MSSRAELSIDISRSTNQKVMRVFDTSAYLDSQPFDDYLLEVLPVNKSDWIVFHISREFSVILNSSNLHYKKVASTADLIDIPDGIYEFRQSYKPNIHTVTNFMHLRSTTLLNRIRSERSKLMEKKCDLCREEYLMNLTFLRDIEEFIIAAEYMVDECHDKKKGKEMYEWAKKSMERYTNKCQC